MAFSEALEVLQRDIKSEDERPGRYCRRCNYEGKKVQMHTATVQWTDDQHKRTQHLYYWSVRNAGT